MTDKWLHSFIKAKIYWLLFAALLLLWFLFCVVYLGDYAYKYPFVQNYHALFSATIPNLFLPLIPIVVGIFCLLNNKRVISIVCGCAFILVLLWALQNSVGELLYSPTICSHTEDLRHYGQYDPKVREAVELNAEGCLPESIPSNAVNARYYYLYEQASADTIYISISWECTDEEMTKHQSKYTINSWEMYDNGKKAAYLTEKSLSGNIQPYIHAVIVFDESNNVITHIVTNNTDFLPQRGSGKLVVPFFKHH